MAKRPFQLTTITYGLACSSYLASCTLKQLVDDHANDFPLGSKTITQELYMDDVLPSADSLAEALRKQEVIINILKEGVFPIRK